MSFFKRKEEKEKVSVEDFVKGLSAKDIEDLKAKLNENSTTNEEVVTENNSNQAQDLQNGETKNEKVEPTDKKEDNQNSNKEIENEPLKEVDETEQANAEVANEQVNDDFVGLSLNDVVLKSDLEKIIGDLNAKISSVTDENAKLKEELSNAKSESKDLHEKYEKDTFGDYSNPKTQAQKNTDAYENWDSYKKKFM